MSPRMISAIAWTLGLLPMAWSTLACRSASILARDCLRVFSWWLWNRDDPSCSRGRPRDADMDTQGVGEASGVS